VAAAPGLRGATEAGSPLDDWLVYLVGGVFAGGLLGATTSGRLGVEVLKGPGFSTRARLAMALSGGVLMGIGARFARGCASGQALTGGALMSVGAWAFMGVFFGGGYALAWWVRRAWR
jgi:uncharacterized membrane protein YedE/YeeE